MRKKTSGGRGLPALVPGWRSWCILLYGISRIIWTWEGKERELAEGTKMSDIWKGNEGLKVMTEK